MTTHPTGLQCRRPGCEWQVTQILCTCMWLAMLMVHVRLADYVDALCMWLAFTSITDAVVFAA